MENSICTHLNAITEIKLTDKHVCEDCITMNTHWVHLRTCQTCGITLCCDQSPQQHMTKHFHKSEHPVIASAERGERWLWCYPDEQFVEY